MQIPSSRSAPLGNERKLVLEESKLETILGYSECRAAIFALKPGVKGTVEVARLQEKSDTVAVGGEPHLFWNVILRMLLKGRM